MSLFRAVRILSSGLTTMVLNEAGECWAQGCLCSSCCSEEGIRSCCWSLHMMESVAHYLLETGVGAGDAGVSCKLDL